MTTSLDATQLDQLIRQRLDEILPAKLEELQAAKTPSLALIASKGTLDWAYPPFILASTAAALGWEVSIFFTFYGLTLLKKDIGELKVSALGNPGMPMKMPFGPQWFKGFDWNKFMLPNLIQSNLPGFETVATQLMKQTIKSKGVASIEELRELSQEAGVKYIACQMTVDLFGFSHADFIDGIDYAGAATFLPVAQQSDVSLFI